MSLDELYLMVCVVMYPPFGMYYQALSMTGQNMRTIVLRTHINIHDAGSDKCNVLNLRDKPSVF